LNLAQTAYRGKNYAKAKDEYNKALRLANQNGDRQKASFVTGQIAECNKAIEEAEIAAEEIRLAEEEALQKEIQTRLASYDFVGRFRLGLSYMIVQRKTDQQWGIIKQDGTEAEAFVYSQVSARLKNDCYALKNEQGWSVFDTSLKKVAVNIEILDDYK
jgi:tetratricopeptide (TPR) repeat protein